MMKRVLITLVLVFVPGVAAAQIPTYNGYIVGNVQGPVFNITGPPYYAVLGGTDDTTAIQSAEHDCATAGGGIVYIPAGVATISSGIPWDSGCYLEGQGPYTTTLRASATFETTSGLRSGLNGTMDGLILLDGTTGYPSTPLTNFGFINIGFDPTPLCAGNTLTCPNQYLKNALGVPAIVQNGIRSLQNGLFQNIYLEEGHLPSDPGSSPPNIGGLFHGIYLLGLGAGTPNGGETYNLVVDGVQGHDGGGDVTLVHGMYPSYATWPAAYSNVVHNIVVRNSSSIVNHDFIEDQRLVLEGPSGGLVTTATAAIAQGATSITVASTTGFSAGQTILLDPANSPTVVTTGGTPPYSTPNEPDAVTISTVTDATHLAISAAAAAHPVGAEVTPGIGGFRDVDFLNNWTRVVDGQGTGTNGQYVAGGVVGIQMNPAHGFFDGFRIDGYHFRGTATGTRGYHGSTTIVAETGGGVALVNYAASGQNPQAIIRGIAVKNIVCDNADPCLGASLHSDTPNPHYVFDTIESRNDYSDIPFIIGTTDSATGQQLLSITNLYADFSQGTYQFWQSQTSPIGTTLLSLTASTGLGLSGTVHVANAQCGGYCSQIIQVNGAWGSTAQPMQLDDLNPIANGLVALNGSGYSIAATSTASITRSSHANANMPQALSFANKSAASGSTKQTDIGSNAACTAGGVAGTLWSVTDRGVGCAQTVDANGNGGFKGTVTALGLQSTANGLGAAYAPPVYSGTSTYLGAGEHEEIGLVTSSSSSEVTMTFQHAFSAAYLCLVTARFGSSSMTAVSTAYDDSSLSKVGVAAFNSSGTQVAQGLSVRCVGT